MFESHRHAGMRSQRLLVTLALVAASAGAGFALGRQPHVETGARQASPATAASLGSAPAPAADDSLPDAADTLGHEKLRDEDSPPTF
jgi:hypothetical protein